MSVLEDEDTATILKMMDFVPTHVDMNQYEGDAIYTGISPMFNEVGIGNKIPEYQIICHKDENQVIDKVEAVEQGS